MIDRTVAPASQKIDSYILPHASTVQLDKGMNLHTLLLGTQDVIRLEVIFKAGNWYEEQTGLAHFTSKMLGEGTSKNSAKDIQDKFAFYGAFMELNSGMDNASITIYTLSKYLDHILPLIYELFSDAQFPENELENMRNITLQGLKVNMEKTAFLAGTRFRELLFGAEHPYGRFLSEEAINKIEVKDLKSFYQKHYTSGSFDIFISGNGKEDFEKSIRSHFKRNTNETISAPGKIDSAPFSKQREVIEKEGSMQSSIRMGKKLFTINHEDYYKVYFLNEILGGYFGSRLMQNIREDKGYTYGIHSSVVTHKSDGYFVIGTDVKREFTQQTIDEIYKEIRRLKTEKVGAEELENVRNYMLGSFVNSISTPFAIADKFKTIYLNGMDYSFYEKYFNTISTMSSTDLFETAQKYFQEEQLLEVVAGGI